MEFDFYAPLQLQDNRVRLEPLESKHFNELLPIALNNPDLLKYSPSPFGTEEALRDYIANAMAQKLAQKRFPFAIYDKLNERYAGSTSLGELSFQHDRLQIGWTWLGKDFQRTGINRRCKFLLLSHAFEILSCERVEFLIDSRNKASIAAIVAIGGKYEGLLRNHMFTSDGHLRSSLYYSILKDEWPLVKNNLFLKWIEPYLKKENGKQLKSHG